MDTRYILLLETIQRLSVFDTLTMCSMSEHKDLSEREELWRTLITRDFNLRIDNPNVTSYLHLVVNKIVDNIITSLMKRWTPTDINLENYFNDINVEPTCMDAITIDLQDVPEEFLNKIPVIKGAVVSLSYPLELSFIYRYNTFLLDLEHCSGEYFFSTDSDSFKEILKRLLYFGVDMYFSSTLVLSPKYRFNELFPKMVDDINVHPYVYA